MFDTVTSRTRFTAALIFRAGLFVLFSIGFLQPVALKADPITFQATTLTSNACSVTFSGDNFSFTYDYVQSSCGGRLARVGVPVLPLPGQESFINPGIALGNVEVPGLPNREAIAYGGGQSSLYKDPEPTYLPGSFTGIVAINVVLSGTVQVCLEPASVYDYEGIVPCDPAYADIGTININVAGQAVYQAYDGDIGARDFYGFTGTSAAAPEPARLGLAGGAALLLWAVVAQRKLRRHADG